MVDYKPILTFLLILIIFGGFIGAVINETEVSINRDNEVMTHLQSLLFPITSKASIDTNKIATDVELIEQTNNTKKVLSYTPPKNKDLSTFQGTINGVIIGMSYIPSFIMIPFLLIYLVSLSLTLTMYVRELIGFT